MVNKKIYLASPMDEQYRKDIYQAYDILTKEGFEVYLPMAHEILNAWDYPNNEWGLMVFTNDVEAIKNANAVVLLSYGRYSTAGANWEAGFAYGLGTTVIVVEMTEEPMSLMVANGRWATVKGLKGLEEYNWKTMPMLRTNTEQK